MSHSMLKIHKEHPTFKINANFGLKNGNPNSIGPKCNRKIMTRVTEVFVTLFFTVKFNYYVFPVVTFNEIIEENYLILFLRLMNMV